MDPVTAAAAISAISSAAQAGSKRNQGGPTRQPTVRNPNFDAAMGRYIGFIDKYMQKHGMGDKIPQPKQMASELAPKSADSRLRKDITDGMVDPNTVMTPVNPPTSTWSDPRVQAAGIAAVGEIGGNLLKGKPKSTLRPTEENPYYWPIQQRYQAIMDNTLRKYGVDVSQAPAWQNEFPIETPIPKPTRPIEQKQEGDGLFSGFLPTYNRPISSNLGQNDQGYADAALATNIAARRLGMQEQPNLMTTKDFQVQDDTRKQEELKNLQALIYGARQASMR